MSPSRADLEASVEATASSLDGRRFVFQRSAHDLDIEVGGYVSIGDGYLGQVYELGYAWIEGAELTAALPASSATDVRIAVVRGGGVVLDAQSTPFHDVPITRATTSAVERHLAERGANGAGLDVGVMLLEEELRVSLDAGGFDRHTFFCGQSGSGKTYALGTVLERLILDTDLRIVVLDPNSDFVRLGEVREGSGPAVADRYREAAVGLVVRRPQPRAAIGCTCGSPTATRRSRPQCFGSIRSRIARSTARSSTCSTAGSSRRRPCRRPASRLLDAPTRRPGARSPDPEPRPAPVADLVGRGRRLGAGPRPAGRPARRDRRPRIAADAGREGNRSRERPRGALAPALGAGADPDRHRRGAQRLSRDPSDPVTALASGTRADRGRGAEVRPLPARVDATTPARERARRVAVRQPRADADDLRRRPRARP